MVNLLILTLLKLLFLALFFYARAGQTVGPKLVYSDCLTVSFSFSLQHDFAAFLLPFKNGLIEIALCSVACVGFWLPQTVPYLGISLSFVSVAWPASTVLIVHCSINYIRTKCLLITYFTSVCFFLFFDMFGK